MQIKLLYKIFSVFFLTVLIIVAFMVFSLRYFMHRHFTDYVNRKELEQISTLTAVLEREYRTEQGWDRLKSDRARWRRMIKAALHDGNAERIDLMERGPRPERREPPISGPGRPLPPPFKEFGRGRLRLFLLDAQKNPVAGRQAPLNEAILRSISVDGKVAGWIGLRKRHAMQTPLEIAFLKQQYVMFYFVGGGILLITAVVSFLLARHLLSPIRQLTEGTQALTSRKFGSRIVVRSQDELGQLAADFNFMAQTLEKYEQMRRQWMTDIAHELRTPLAVLQGEIEAMLDGVRQVSLGRLESLHAEIFHLGNIVNDLHELSLAETRALPFRKEPVNPVRVLEEVLESFETRLAQRRIRVIDDLGADREITLLGDAARLNQLFVNLLENCVRYCDSPGALAIRQKREGESWTLCIEDSGPGVPEACVDHLFDRFYRVDKSRSRAMGGSGLGLSICKSIVETLGGDIRACNAPSGGLRIEMTFLLM